MEETTVKALFALYLIIGLLTAEGIVVWNEGLKEMLDDEYGRVVLCPFWLIRRTTKRYK